MRLAAGGVPGLRPLARHERRSVDDESDVVAAASTCAGGASQVRHWSLTMLFLGTVVIISFISDLKSRHNFDKLSLYHMDLSENRVYSQ